MTFALALLIAGLWFDPRLAAGAASAVPVRWLAAGIALAVLWRWDTVLAPVVVAAGIATTLAAGLTWSAACGLGIGQAAAAAWGARRLHRLHVDPAFSRESDVLQLAATACLAAAVGAANDGLWLALDAARLEPELATGVFVRWAWGAAGSILVTLAWPAAGFRRALRPPADTAATNALALSALALPAAFAAALAGRVIAAWLVPLVGAATVCTLVLLAWQLGLAAAAWAALAALGAVALAAAPPGALEPASPFPLSMASAGILVAAGWARARRRGEAPAWMQILDGRGIAVAEWDPRGRLRYASPQWLARTGGARGGTKALEWVEALHPQDEAAARAAAKRVHDGQAAHESLSARWHDGRGWQWVDIDLAVVERDAAGRVARTAAVVAEADDRRRALERERLASQVFRHLHEGLLLADAEWRVLDANPAATAMLGATRGELLGTVPAFLRADLAESESARDAAAAARRDGHWDGELTTRRHDGNPCALRLSLSTVAGTPGTPAYRIIVLSDLTEQRRAQESLQRQAQFDALTRLPNQARLRELLADAIALAHERRALLAVCHLDLDHFKAFNELHGRETGHRALAEVARRLRQSLRCHAVGADVAARVGGDEFVVLMHARHPDEIAPALDRLLRLVNQPLGVQALEAASARISASAGAALYPLDASDPDALLRQADQAMYGAKQAGRNGFMRFDSELCRRNEQRVQAVSRVQHALDRQELVLHFQPKVDLRDGRTVGAEALLRWQHPTSGLMPPAQFLPLIEHTGLSARVGDWVLEQAIAQLAHWRGAGLELAVSVNISARHLQEPGFAARLTALLERHGRALGPWLELEVLESAALSDIALTSALLHECRELGVRFALDDFGTGYSTLTYLRQLPVDVLKIDRSFVQSMRTDAQDRAIVQGVVGLARTFGCEVVAEGVEDPDQARELLALGCHLGQGQGLAAPMPARELPMWLRRGPPGPWLGRLASEEPAAGRDAPA